MDWTEELTPDNISNSIGCRTCGAAGRVFTAEAGWCECRRCEGTGWDPRPWECAEYEGDDWKW